MSVYKHSRAKKSTHADEATAIVAEDATAMIPLKIELRLSVNTRNTRMRLLVSVISVVGCESLKILIT